MVKRFTLTRRNGNSRLRRKFCTITPKAWLCTTPLRELPFRRKTTPNRTSHTESLRQRTFERQSRAGELLLYGIVAITCPRARRSPLRKRTCLPPVPHSPCSPRSLAPFLKRPSRFPSWRKTVLRNGAKLYREGRGGPMASGRCQIPRRATSGWQQFRFNPLYVAAAGAIL